MRKTKEMTLPLDAQLAPADWSDRKAWDRYHQANPYHGPSAVPTEIGAAGWESVRFFDLVKARGGHIWFPGCGTDIGPRFYASVGCRVVATDFSPAAVRAQRSFAASPPERLFTNWPSFVRQREASAGSWDGGSLEVVEQDFTTAAPDGRFDVVLNRCAFQGLSPQAKRRAAQRFFTALRPGGAAIIDTMNVHGSGARNEIEDSLAEAGFYLPFSATERWYREQLDSTGIAYGMLMGRPRVRYNRNNSGKGSMAQWERDQSILDSFQEEYKARQAQEEPAVRENCNKPETIVAHVVYPTG